MNTLKHKTKGTKLTKVNILGISVDNKIREDGRWQARYILGQKQISIYGTSRKDVEKKAVSKIKLKTTADTSQMTYSKWIDKWMQLYKVPKIRNNTLKSYTYTINKYLTKQLGHYRLNQLTANILQEAINNIEFPRQREIACNLIFASLSKAYNTGLIKKNIALAIEKVKVKHKERRALTSNEITLLLDFVKGNKYELLTYIYIYTGLRRSEALALKWSDINTKLKTINVKYQVDELRVLRDLKTSKAKRIVPILPPLADILTKQVSLGKNDDFVYSDKPSTITKQFRLIFNNIGLIDIDVHSLRHTYSTILKDMNVPDDLRSKWLGHSKIDHKDRYEHIREEYQNKEINKLTKLFDTNF